MAMVKYYITTSMCTYLFTAGEIGWNAVIVVELGALILATAVTQADWRRWTAHWGLQ